MFPPCPFNNWDGFGRGITEDCDKITNASLNIFNNFSSLVDSKIFIDNDSEYLPVRFLTVKKGFF